MWYGTVASPIVVTAQSKDQRFCFSLNTMRRSVEYRRSHTLPDGFRLTEIHSVLSATTNDEGDHSHIEQLIPDEKEKDSPTSGSTATSSDGPYVPPLNNNWGRGIINDFRRTVQTHWVSEMTNGNLKTVAVSFFLYDLRDG